MGEYAEIQWQRDMARGFRVKTDQEKPYVRRRNEIAAHCDICGKGIRPTRGCTKWSMRQHKKYKHGIIDTEEKRNG